MHITTIGLDIAKNVFQVHGIDAAEKVVTMCDSAMLPLSLIRSHRGRRDRFDGGMAAISVAIIP